MADQKLGNISEHKNLELETIHNETLKEKTLKEKKNEWSIHELQENLSGLTYM